MKRVNKFLLFVALLFGMACNAEKGAKEVPAPEIPEFFLLLCDTYWRETVYLVHEDYAGNVIGEVLWPSVQESPWMDGSPLADYALGTFRVSFSGVVRQYMMSDFMPQQWLYRDGAVNCELADGIQAIRLTVQMFRLQYKFWLDGEEMQCRQISEHQLVFQGRLTKNIERMLGDKLTSDTCYVRSVWTKITSDEEIAMLDNAPPI